MFNQSSQRHGRCVYAAHSRAQKCRSVVVVVVVVHSAASRQLCEGCTRPELQKPFLILLYPWRQFHSSSRGGLAVPAVFIYHSTPSKYSWLVTTFSGVPQLISNSFVVQTLASETRTPVSRCSSLVMLRGCP